MKKTTKILKFCLLQALVQTINIDALAQHAVSGKVTDRCGASVELATVRVLTKDSIFVAGTNSDASGIFRIEGLQSGEYLLCVSHIDYVKQYQSMSILQKDANLGNIVVQDEPHELSNVHILADRIIKKKDGMIVHPTKDQKKFSSTGYDLISNIMIPGVDVDRQNNVIFQNGRIVSIYIDGQKAETQELVALNIDKVSKIEYIDMPSGKYVRDDVVINVIMKTEESGTYVAVDDQQNLIFMQNKLNFTVQHTNGNRAIQLYGGNDYRDYNNVGSHLLEVYNIGDSIIERGNDMINDRICSNGQYVQLNIKKKEKDRNMWTKLSFVHNSTPCNDALAEIKSISKDTLCFLSNETISSKGYKPRLDLHGDFNLPNGQILDFTISGMFCKNEYRRVYEEPDFMTLTDAEESLYRVGVDGNYSKQFKRSSLSVCFYDNYRISKTDYVGTLASKQQLITNECILWLGYMCQFSPRWILNVRAGASSLNYHLNDSATISQFFPRMNASLRYSFAQNQAFTLYGNVGNSFPTITTLNSSTQYVNSILLKKGNPFQEISRMYNSMLMYNYFSKKLTIQAAVSGDYYTDINMSSYYVQDGTIVCSYNSNSDYYKLMAAVMGTYSILDNFYFKFNIASIHTRFSGAVDWHRSMVGGIFELNYYLKNLKINLSAKTKEKRLTESGVFEDDFLKYGVNIVWSKMNWLAEMGADNIFANNNRLHRHYCASVYSFHGSTFNTLNQRSIFVKVQYRFNHGKKVKTEKKSVESEIETAIMEAK